jgi:hypothetical protein
MEMEGRCALELRSLGVEATTIARRRASCAGSNPARGERGAQDGGEHRARFSRPRAADILFRPIEHP